MAALEYGDGTGLVMAGDVVDDGFGTTFTVRSAGDGVVTMTDGRTYPADVFGMVAATADGAPQQLVSGS